MRHIKLSSLLVEDEGPKDPNQSKEPGHAAADQAHKLGLTAKGWGYWQDKSGNVVAKTIQGQLVKLDAPEASDEFGDDRRSDDEEDADAIRSGMRRNIEKATGAYDEFGDPLRGNEVSDEYLPVLAVLNKSAPDEEEKIIRTDIFRGIMKTAAEMKIDPKTITDEQLKNVASAYTSKVIDQNLDKYKTSSQYGKTAIAHALVAVKKKATETLVLARNLDKLPPYPPPTKSNKLSNIAKKLKGWTGYEGDSPKNTQIK